VRSNPFVTALAALVLVPIALAGGFAVGVRSTSSPLDGMTKVSTDEHYGWVVTAGKFKGQTTDPKIVLTYAPKDRPPAEFKLVSCDVYASGPKTALADRAVQVCSARTVPEAEVRKALEPEVKTPS
jgi:hypothetical protein